MRRETVALVEAVRELGVELDPRPDNPDAVRLNRPKESFPSSLAKLKRALDAWDRASATSRENGFVSDDAALQDARLRIALDAVFRWMKTQGMDIHEPGLLVAAALKENPNASATTTGRRAASPSPKPSFAPESVKRAMKPKPLLTVAPEQWETITLSGLRQRALRGHMTLESLGAAAPR